jgi:hypothetical protein
LRPRAKPARKFCAFLRDTFRADSRGALPTISVWSMAKKKTKDGRISKQKFIIPESRPIIFEKSKKIANNDLGSADIVITAVNALYCIGGLSQRPEATYFFRFASVPQLRTLPERL